MSPTKDGDGDDRDHADDDAFAEAVRGARPLAKRDARATIPPANQPRRSRPAPAAGATPRCIVEQSGDAITGRAPDVSNKVLRELRAGAHAVEARLDLHGRGRADTLRGLESVVTGARARGARALLVIHGRGHGSDAGGPVLRPAVWEWLASTTAERCGVMAFASAGPRDGGAGATIVLLRRAGH
jgi:DNA-nicking Smr family endonuclease